MDHHRPHSQLRAVIVPLEPGEILHVGFDRVGLPRRHIPKDEGAVGLLHDGQRLPLRIPVHAKDGSPRRDQHVVYDLSISIVDMHLAVHAGRGHIVARRLPCNSHRARPMLLVIYVEEKLRGGLSHPAAIALVLRLFVNPAFLTLFLARSLLLQPPGPCKPHSPLRKNRPIGFSKFQTRFRARIPESASDESSVLKRCSPRIYS